MIRWEDLANRNHDLRITGTDVTVASSDGLSFFISKLSQISVSYIFPPYLLTKLTTNSSSDCEISLIR